MLLKSRQDSQKGPAGGAHFQVKLRSRACHLDFQNIIQNWLCIYFTGALKDYVYFKLVNKNTKNISSTLCNMQTLK